MAISNKGNLSNLCYLTEFGGVKVLRKVFLTRVVELKPETEDPETWTVDKFLKMKKEKIESAKLTPKSKLIIFPVGGKQTNLDLWDFSLFCDILKVTCSLSASVQTNMSRLKKIHNKIAQLAYFEDLNITEYHYETYFAQLRYIFEHTLNELNDKALQENIREMLQKSYDGLIPLDELSKALSALQRNCEDRKIIVEAEHYETRQRLERGNSRLLAILTKIQERLTATNIEYTGTTIPVKIITPQSPDMAEHLTESLVDMFNGEIKNIPGVLDSNDDERSSREAVHTFYKTFKEKGYEIVKAEIGCILLHIQFSSVASLLSFYFDYFQGDLDKYLDFLQKASRDFLRYQEIQFEIILYNDDFQQALSDIQDHADWTGNRRLASIPDYNQMELFEKDWDIAPIRLTVIPPPHFERVELKQLIIAEFKRLSKAFTFSTFTLKNLKRISFGDDEDKPKKIKTNGEKSYPHVQLRSKTDGYSYVDTERHNSTKTGNEITLRQFVVPSAVYRRYYYTYNNAQLIAKKYGNIVCSFDRSNEIDLPCFDDVNLFFFSGDTSVDLPVVDDTSREYVKESKLTITFDSIDLIKDIARDTERRNENAVSIFISTRDVAESLCDIRFSPHFILVDDDKLKSLRFEEIQNVKKCFRHELATTISSLLEDMLLIHLVKMIESLEKILGVNGSCSSSQNASVSTDVLSGKENHGYVTLSNTSGDSKKDEAQELYEDILALFYRTGKPWKTAFEDMVKTLDKEIAKEILQVNGVTSVGYKLDVLHIFLDDSMDKEGRQFTENRLKRLLEKHRIARYEFHYEQGKLEQYAEVGSVLKAGERAGALGCFATLSQRKELCILFSKHVSLGGNSLLVEDPPKSGKFMRFATLISSNTPDSEPLDIAIAKVLKDPGSCQVLFKDEFGKGMPSIVCSFDNTIWLNRLPVHISRAAGSPGLGIIIIPVLDMETAQDMYLKIEDRDVNNRFANPGDSGAIVCANDIRDGLKVHVIAMLIGSSNEDEVNQSSKTKRQYVAFRLIQGVMQLERELKEDINLF